MPKPHADPAKQLRALGDQRQMAEQAVLDAQRDLERALLAHQDTRPARARLTAAEQRRGQIKDAIAGIEQQIDADRADATASRAAEITTQIDAGIDAMLDRFPLIDLEIAACP